LDIHIHTGLGIQTIYDIRAPATDCDYVPMTNKEFHDALFRDEPRSGRPWVLNDEDLGMKENLT
jgi:hypothetical protein